jgi:hypothetical protein
MTALTKARKGLGRPEPGPVAGTRWGTPGPCGFWGSWLGWSWCSRTMPCPNPFGKFAPIVNLRRGSLGFARGVSVG